MQRRGGNSVNNGPINVVIAMLEREKAERLKETLEQGGSVRVLNICDSGEQCRREAINARSLVDVIIAQANLADMSGTSIAQKMRLDLPWVSVVLLTNGNMGGQPTVQDMSAALAAGASACHTLPTRPEDYIALRGIAYEVGNTARERRTAIAASNRGTGSGGAVIVVYGPKGGVGRTVVAAKLAFLLAHYAPGGSPLKVALCELGVPMTDLPPLLGMANPTTTVRNLIGIKNGFSGDQVRAAMIPCPMRENLRALCGPVVESDEPLTATHVSSILFNLRQDFDYTVVDTAAGYSAVTRQALWSATQHVLVTTPDRLAFAHTQRAFRATQSLDKETALVINRFRKSSGDTVKDIAASLGIAETSTFAILDQPDTMREELAFGVLMKNDARGFSFAEQLNKLSELAWGQWRARPAAVGA